jgi:hypothetical protein
MFKIIQNKDKRRDGGSSIQRSNREGNKAIEREKRKTQHYL